MFFPVDGAWGAGGKGGQLGPLPAELTIALIAGIAFVVIVFVLVVGLLCLKRYVPSNLSTQTIMFPYFIPKEQFFTNYRRSLARV